MRHGGAGYYLEKEQGFYVPYSGARSGKTLPCHVLDATPLWDVCASSVSDAGAQERGLETCGLGVEERAIGGGGGTASGSLT